MQSLLSSSRARRCFLACAGVVLAAAGCKDGGTGPDESVESVTVTGAPAGPLLSGGTVQLVANPINSTGAAVSGAKVSWSSSDTLVAKVSGQGLVSAVGAGPVSITASVGEKRGAAALDVRAGGVVGPDGGTLNMLGGAVTLAVPADALPQATTLLLRPAPSPPAHARFVAGAAFELGPEAMSFYKGATLTLRYDAARIPAGVAPTSLQLYTLSNGAWTVVRGSRVDAAARTVAGTLFRSGTYAVIGTGAEQVSLTGPLVNGALYAGQSGQLSAAVLDINRDTLQGRSVTWASSDPARATVDTLGKVTALAPGTTTITATADDKSATTSLTVLARPAASWSQTAEWGTFQGNARHTGEIAATVDPAVFREIWTISVGNVPVKPVSEGGGGVYVTAGQRLFAIDIATGAQKWSQSFGSINSVDPAAYAGGRVYLTTGGHSDSFLWAFDAGTGAVQFKSAYQNQWSSYYAPTVVGQTVYMAGGYYGGMYAFSATDGKQLWFASTNQYDEWTPAVSDGRVYAYTGSYSPQLAVVNASTGAALYEIKDPAFAWSGWSMDAAPVLGSMNNMVATQGGRLLSFDLQNRRIGWEHKAGFSGNVTVAGGVLYVVNNKQVEARSEADGSFLWSWAPPAGEPRGTMIATRNVLFVSTAAHTYAVDIGAKRHTWSYPAGGNLALSKDGTLLIARQNGSVSAISVR